MKKHDELIDKIENCLPQTQCQLCSYAGCRPYAEAIVGQQETVNRCLPGGTTTLVKLGALLNINVESMMAEMTQKTKFPAVAVIREAECIGCTKCITACPVDAIIGSTKLMHTIISQVCTGCELCVPACPVDCIDLVNINEPDEEARNLLATTSKQRYLNRQARLSSQEQEENSSYETAKLQQQDLNQTIQARQNAIKLAVKRASLKKKISDSAPSL